MSYELSAKKGYAFFVGFGSAGGADNVVKQGQDAGVIPLTPGAGLNNGKPWVSAHWESCTIGSTASVSYASIALDAGNRPYISYYSAANTNIQCAHFNGSSWDTWVIDTSNNKDEGMNAIATNAAGSPCIVYTCSGLFKYAFLNNSVWSKGTIEDRTMSGFVVDSALSVDSAGRFHAAVYTGPAMSDCLDYAYWTDTCWLVQQNVDGAAGPDIGACPSIGADENNYPHIAYYDIDNSDLKYCKWNGASWDIITLDSEVSYSYSSNYRSTSIAVRSDSNIFICYYDSNPAAKGLKYARYNGTNWESGTLFTGSVGRDCSAKIDAGGSIHISYYDEANKCLVYARSDSTSWETQALTALNSNTGRNSSICLDSGGNPHIAYTDYANGTLCYVRWVP